MNQSTNQVTLIGRVGHDLDLRSTNKNGTPVTNFDMCEDETWRDQDGNFQKRPRWHKITAYGKKAEILVERVRKGALLCVTGEIRYQTRKFDRTVTLLDGSEGTFEEKQQQTEILVGKFNLLAKSKKQVEEEQQQDEETDPSITLSDEFLYEDEEVSVGVG